mmetsp:Transcript_23691/g.51732  ORF Transcript_23691/g.51732 Transcript_23691/m.51732 type:complete len:209 (+) Transcript_23691:64-690(+)
MWSRVVHSATRCVSRLHAVSSGVQNAGIQPTTRSLFSGSSSIVTQQITREAASCNSLTPMAVRQFIASCTVNSASATPMRAIRGFAACTATPAMRPTPLACGSRQQLIRSTVLGGSIIRPWVELGVRGMANKGGNGKNKAGTRKYKIKSWSALKRRFHAVKGGMKRMQAGTRHNAKNKTRRRRKQLVGMVPVFKPFVKKIKKLGFKGT